MLRLVIVFIFLFIIRNAFPQIPADSLLQKLDQSDNAGKILIYNQLAEAYIQKDSVLVFEYAGKAFDLAKKGFSIEGQGRANYLKAEAYYFADSYEKAINYYLKSQNNYFEIGDTTSLIEISNSIGLCQFYLQHFEQALQYYLDGLRFAEKSDDKEQMARLYSNIAMVNTKMKDYNNALVHYRKALDINTKLNRPESVGVNLNGIGVTFFRMEEMDSSKVFYQRALNVFRETNNQERIAILLNNIANIYVNQVDSVGKALAYYLEAEKVFTNLGYNQNVIHVIEGIGSVYREMKLYNKAIETYQRGVELIKQMGPDYQLLQLYYSDLSKTYELLGNYKQALESEKTQHQYADSLLNRDRLNQIATLEKQFDSEKKEAEINRLKVEQELSRVSRNRDRYLKILGFVSAFFLLLALFYVSYRYNEKKKINKILAEKNRQIKEREEGLRVLNVAKNKFFSIISHDLKSPFHMVMGYSQLLSKDYNSYSDEDRRKFAQNIYKSANTIFRLLSNLLDWSRSQTDRITFNPIEIEFVLIYDNVVNLLKANADQKNIALRANFDEGQIIYADPVMLETVIRNLVNNAIKYTLDGGEIVVSVEQTEEKITICVEDDGIGIKTENLERLFQIDSKVKQKGTHNEDGSGIGLILCKELIDKHQGRIWAESNMGKGSRFFVELPQPLCESLE